MSVKRNRSEYYKLSNVVPCCGDYNKIKGKTLTYSEMLLLSPILKIIRKARNDNQDD